MYCHCIQTADRVMCKSPVAIHCTHRSVNFNLLQPSTDRQQQNGHERFLPKKVSISLRNVCGKLKTVNTMWCYCCFLFTLDKYIKIKCSCSTVQLFLLSTVLYTLVEIKTPLENTTHLGELPSLLLSYLPQCNG